MNSKTIAYEIEDRKKTLPVTGVGNLLLFVAFAVNDAGDAFHEPHAIMALIVGLLFLVLTNRKDWNNPNYNQGLIILYLVIFLVEMVGWGIPSGPYVPRYNQVKGFAFDLFMATLPYVYVGLRLFFVVPLLLMNRALRKIPT